MGKRIFFIAVLMAIGTAIFIYLKKDNASTTVEKFSEQIETKSDSNLSSKAPASQGSKLTGRKIGWKRLAQMDYLTGKVPDTVKSLESEVIRIPGFIVPLTDEWESFDEFLIVQDPQACIHVPAPPPNQVLYVKTKKKLPVSLMSYPLWFQGKLKIVNTDSDFGRAGYQLTLQRMEIYSYQRVNR